MRLRANGSSAFAIAESRAAGLSVESGNQGRRYRKRPRCTVMSLSFGGALWTDVSFGVVLGFNSDWKFQRMPGRLSSTTTGVSSTSDSITTSRRNAAMKP